MSSDQITVSFRISKPRSPEGTPAWWQALVDGTIVGEWFGDEPDRKGFLFHTFMEGVTHHRQWRSAVQAEFQRRVRTNYRLRSYISESWTSKPSSYGWEEWHGVNVGGCEYSHMVGLITGQTFEERLEQMTTMRESHRRVCSVYTAYGDED
jgi:hypothetical protein